MCIYIYIYIFVCTGERQGCSEGRAWPRNPMGGPQGSKHDCRYTVSCSIIMLIITTTTTTTTIATKMALLLLLLLLLL